MGLIALTYEKIHGIKLSDEFETYRDVFRWFAESFPVKGAALKENVINAGLLVPCSSGSSAGNGSELEQTLTNLKALAREVYFSNCAEEVSHD